MRRRRRPPVAAIAAAATVALAVGAVPAVDAAELAPRATTTARPHVVTLITGDRLTLAGDGQVGIEPGRGRERIAFVMSRHRGRTTVIPADALPYLRAGRVDPRLFDVTTLVASGYDDRRADLPLIVTSPATGAARSAAPARPSVPRGLRVTRELPAVLAVAARLARADAGAAWTAIKARGTAATVPTVWLDGLRRPTLDESVPQIGAPSAWSAGYTGAGVRVAVVDSGVDASHPDLAGKVDASRSFIEGLDDRDTHGHGTHVASTIAGTGAASAGRYSGVAPGARLVAAKVCDGLCPESAILAGMQWAVTEQHAAIVNMSLGEADSPGVDPIEQAVEELSAAHGTLFVIAAGNAGADRSVGSPGSAPSALTVGAVDKADALADLSSRGPVVENSALKPDITAPGVDITAARSNHSSLPGGPDSYHASSGTSMATPHVAGAAAILAQLHPDWDGVRLKAALMGSARPNPEIGIYGQGAGRVDVAHAITQTVTTSPASVSFGLQMWPHTDDEPVARTVTYHNAGAAPVTLSLTVDATGPDGAAAAAGLFTLSATSLTVPAGGRSEVTLTADTRAGGPDGLAGGYVVATAGGVVTRTPFAVEKEVESYDLELPNINRAGAPTGNYFVRILDLDTGADHIPYDADGTVNVRLPRGRYLVHSTIVEPDDIQVSQLVQPVLDLSRARRVVMDARTAGPVSARVPRSDATQFFATILFGVPTGPGRFVFGVGAERFEDLFLGAVGGNVQLPGLITMVKGLWAKAGPDGTVDDSPYTYNLAWAAHDRALSRFHREVRDRDLAKVKARYLSQLPDGTGLMFAFSRFTDLPFGGSRPSFFRTPFDRTEFYTPGPGLVWDLEFDEESVDADGNLANWTAALAFGRGYRAGRAHNETWNRPMFGPGFPGGYDPAETGFALRFGNDIFVSLPLFSDGSGRAGFSSQIPPSSVTLARDGVELPGDFGIFPVPADPGDYTLTAVATRGEPFVLSTMVKAAWRFRSGFVDDTSLVPLALSAVRFAPDLDEAGFAPAGRVVRVPVAVQSQLGSSAGATTSLRVEVSYDDGATWTQVQLRREHGRTVAVLSHPDGPAFVSLRATAADAKGNSVEQTIIRAYRTR